MTAPAEQRPEMHPAPAPARGFYAPGFESVARCFAEHLATGQEIGAGFSAYHRGDLAVDLWGGLADRHAQTPWEHDTRVVVFSVTKGLVAMAMHLLADRGKLAWDAPVASYWPGFAGGGKDTITVEQLFNHRGGLPYLDTRLTLEDCTDSSRAGAVLEAMERQEPAWRPGSDQGYHALTYGMYGRELFERITGESLGAFLTRELFEPLGSDARLGTPPELDAKTAKLYAPANATRALRMITRVALAPHSTESSIVRDVLRRDSVSRRAFDNPAAGRRGVLAYDDVAVRRSELAWASATSSADGLARAYLPFAGRGTHRGRRYFRTETLAPIEERRSWSLHDRVLHKPLGWSRGFLKEQRHLFSPNPGSFGHAGMGGALGWCDPTADLALGYVMNAMDWRVRSPRIIALCRALYRSLDGLR
jgi:CubicO group peptidase (beta-lactamase class C family)